MGTEAKHTPTPWYIAKTNGGKTKITSHALDKKVDWAILSVPGRSMADTQFAVLAVNHHDRLVEALREFAGEPCRTPRPRMPCRPGETLCATCSARALLAEIDRAQTGKAP